MLGGKVTDVGVWAWWWADKWSTETGKRVTSSMYSKSGDGGVMWCCGVAKMW